MAPLSQRVHLPVVGIGASAGGLEAIEGFLHRMPVDSGMAFVILTHLRQGQRSALADILRRATAMPVVAAVDRGMIAANHVYVLANEASLALEDGCLRVGADGASPRERHPIDHFLRSLARDRGADAIGVILSGLGNDGTLGIKAIKEAGGLTVAQHVDGSGPSYDGMPGSAIATGLVDLVLPVHEMAGRLVEYVRSFAVLGGITDQAAISGATRVRDLFETICTTMQRRCGHDFRSYKEHLIMRRVQRRMQVLELVDLERYVILLEEDGREVDLLHRDLLLNVTSFFRDPQAFAALEAVIPRLFEGKGAEDAVRIWAPGCSSGEEAYSLAILLCEHMERQGARTRVQLFATDIDEASLARARSGRYLQAHTQGLSPERQERFFKGDGTWCTVAREVRDLCTFSPHSIVRDPPFAHLDLISCRNLLIYLDEGWQERSLRAFHFGLRADGHLFLGATEGIARHGELFAAVSSQAIFRRRERTSMPQRASLAETRWPLPATTSVGPRPPPATGAGSLRQLVDRRVLEHFAPAHVVVDREADIVFYSPRTGPYLEPPVGTPNRQLLNMARPGLRLALAAALHEVIETGLPVTPPPVAFQVDGRQQLVALHLETLTGRDGEPLFLVVFTDHAAPDGADAATSPQALADSTALDRVEGELLATRERLQSTIEEFETAIEELASGNEELLSINEERTTTGEELTSVNEELSAVNDELKDRLRELDEANADLRNLFDGTAIATIFLDARAVIRSFTPAATAIFNLIPGDRGRPLTDIASQLEEQGLRADILGALARREVLEQAVHRRDGTAHYLMRILPYRRTDEVIDGAVVTFVEVTPLVRAEAQQRLLVAELNHRVRNMLQVVTSVAAQTLKHSPSPESFAEGFISRLQALGRAYGLLSRESWADIPLAELVRQQILPYAGEDGRLKVTGGPRVLLKPKAALAFGMVLHELATNAAKYGSLSTPQGGVEVSWRLTGRDSAATPELTLLWRERGGPLVRPAERQGFGSSLIERQLAYEFAGHVVQDLAPDGLRASLLLRLDPSLAVLPPAEVLERTA